MAELTREEALSKYSLLQELLETEDYERLDPEGNYPGEEEEVEDELSALQSWARKQELVFAWQNDAWVLVPADEDTKATWKARRWIHRNVGLIGSFMLQDKHEEGYDNPASVDSTSIVGVLPHKEDEPRTWLVHVQATADSGFGYSYPTEFYLTIHADAEGEPVVSEATESQVKQLTESEATNGRTD